MADKAHRFADRVINEIEARLKREYARAQKEMQAKWAAYMKKAQARLDTLYNAYKTAPADKKATALQRYQQAARNVTLNNRWYKEMVDELTTQLAHTNAAALAYINGRLPEVYHKAFNLIDPRVKELGVNFSLVDQSTVRRMILDGRVKLPKKKLSVPKDKQWNTKAINSEVLQGILQGESIPDIAKRVFPELMKKENLRGLSEQELAKVVQRNWTAAMRNTRTLITGAENRGRYDRYKDLEDHGVILTKEWIATPDGHTRDWHIVMDGQEVGVNENFLDGLGNELEYPGDPGAEPETVWNCRCSMKSNIQGIRGKNGHIQYLDRGLRSQEPTFHEQQIAKEKERRENG